MNDSNLVTKQAVQSITLSNDSPRSLLEEHMAKHYREAHRGFNALDVPALNELGQRVGRKSIGIVYQGQIFYLPADPLPGGPVKFPVFVQQITPYSAIKGHSGINSPLPLITARAEAEGTIEYRWEILSYTHLGGWDYTPSHWVPLENGVNPNPLITLRGGVYVPIPVVISDSGGYASLSLFLQQPDKDRVTDPATYVRVWADNSASGGGSALSGLCRCATARTS